MDINPAVNIHRPDQPQEDHHLMAPAPTEALQMVKGIRRGLVHKGSQDLVQMAGEAPRLAMVLVAMSKVYLCRCRNNFKAIL